MRDNLHVAMAAETYHQYISTSAGPWDELMIRRFSEEYRPSPHGRTVIDVGTGTAVLLMMLARMPQFEDATYVGMDLFPDMIEVARRALVAAGLEHRIRLDVCDVHHMPYPDGTADYVISRSTIHHWADPVQAFAEIFRILRPGGLALLHDPRRDPNPQFLEDFNRRRCAAGLQPNDLAEKYTAAEVTVFLERAGIRECCLISAPADGPASMGYEVRIAKPSVAQAGG